MRLAIVTSVLMLSFIFSLTAFAGNLDSPAPASDPGSAMYKLDDVYNRVDTGAAGAKRTGGFAGPAAAPGSTGHTTDQIISKSPVADDVNGALPTDVKAGKKYWGITSGKWGVQTGIIGNISPGPAPNEKTGQDTSYGTRDDGALKMGETWASPRFTDNGDGTIKDNNTGLIWLKNANCFGTKTWAAAITSCSSLASGSCGLTDSSVAGQWRLPNVKELSSLIDSGRYNPALPIGHPFSGVQSFYYWSSSTYASGTSYAWIVYFDSGNVYSDDKTSSYYVLPVRGGQ